MFLSIFLATQGYQIFIDINEIISGGINSLFSERIKANVALDMQAKMREDPLFAIRYHYYYYFKYHTDILWPLVVNRCSTVKGELTLFNDC